MEKIINGTRISFCMNGVEKMEMGFYGDEFVWFFRDSDVVSVTKDMELYHLLDHLLSQKYTFSNSTLLRDYPDSDRILWYSDCYYNPDDDLSVKGISFLTIRRAKEEIQLFCTKPLDEIIKREKKYHAISFSTGGNGKFSRNHETGATFQDDFVQNVYYRLLDSNKVKKRNGVGS